DLTARADKLALRYHDEIGQLAKSFNEMADSVQSMVNGQQRLLGDISHEIRTPLTRLQLANAIHRRQFGDNEELTRIEQETETIDKMLNQLLALSRSTLSGEHPFEQTDFSFFMEDIIDNARFEAHQAQVELVNDIAADITISVQWDSLASAIENIIRNAIRYAKQRVDFSAYQDADNLIINIVDDGCGVDDDHLSNLFTPFYRVSTSRDRKTGGTGLGLAIAHEAVKRHQGNIVASNNEQGGLTVTISLPLTSDKDGK
ncbi:MAG: ATP-binding protein, partial [Psychrobium sp.]